MCDFIGRVLLVPLPFPQLRRVLRLILSLQTVAHQFMVGMDVPRNQAILLPSGRIDHFQQSRQLRIAL